LIRLKGEQMRRIRRPAHRRHIQDPLTSLNPLYTVGMQLVETIRTHMAVDAAEARAAQGSAA
jgi:peptide/nickel transport system ATP-binding protein